VRRLEATERLLLSVHEAAQVLGIGRDTMYRLCREHRVPVLRVGHRILVPRAALEGWIEQEIAQNPPADDAP
jgi:excisionase family DNA binding protein